MDYAWIEESTLIDIADAIRNQTATAESLDLKDMIITMDQIKNFGQYLFSKKEMEGSSVIGYAVADELAKYPDEGWQDGYYWECVGTPPPPCKIVSWADGTDEEIVAMVSAADAGYINLADYWSVGDERTMSLSAMSATGVGESHATQTVTMVLMNAGGKELADGRECSFIVGSKSPLVSRGYMNSGTANTGSWESSARRTWCNNVFYNAVPESIRSIFKQHKNITASDYNSVDLTTSLDYFALPAMKEIIGNELANNNTGGSTVNEFNALNQFEYYKDVNTRKLSDASGAYYWWLRSPFSTSYQFCCVNTSGMNSCYTSNSKLMITPFGCI